MSQINSLIPSDVSDLIKESCFMPKWIGKDSFMKITDEQFQNQLDMHKKWHDKWHHKQLPHRWSYWYMFEQDDLLAAKTD